MGTEWVLKMASAMATLTSFAQRSYHALYRPTSTEEGGTATADVFNALVATPGMPDCFTSMEMGFILREILRAGEGEVPPIVERGRIGESRGTQRKRGQCMECVRWA